MAKKAMARTTNGTVELPPVVGNAPPREFELLDPPDVEELSSGRSAEHSSAESLEVSMSVSQSTSTDVVPSGVTGADSSEATLVPMALVAVTVNV